MCGRPQNPDKILIGCTSLECNKWLHVECLVEDALRKTYERLGKTKPHNTTPTPAKEPTEEEEGGKQPLSPKEPTTEATLQTIDVKSDGVSDKTDDNVLVKEDVKASTAREDSLPGQVPLDLKPTGSVRGRPKKKTKQDVAEKPWLGLFEVSLMTDATPPTFEVKDLREDVSGGEKVWTEHLLCPVCQTQIN
jgi:hypothetical protein